MIVRTVRLAALVGVAVSLRWARRALDASLRAIERAQEPAA